MIVRTKNFVPYKHSDVDIIIKVTEALKQFKIVILNREQNYIISI